MTIDQGTGRNGQGPDDEDYFENGTYSDMSDDREFEELDLIEDEEPLPWLESDYDEEDQGVDTGRLIGFVLLSLVALGSILAAVWFFMRDKPDPDLMPEGSTIEAPAGAVKERPEDAGGKTFEGTGNIAPTVGEGQATEGRLGTGANSDTAPKPSIDVASTSPATGAAAGTGAATGTGAVTGTGAATGAKPGAGSAGSVGVQVGAFSSRESANAAWSTLKGQTSLLNGVNSRIVEGEVDGAKVYRLQAVAGDGAAANTLCNALKNDGIACQVKR